MAHGPAHQYYVPTHKLHHDRSLSIKGPIAWLHPSLMLLQPEAETGGQPKTSMACVCLTASKPLPHTAPYTIHPSLELGVDDHIAGDLSSFDEPERLGGLSQ